VSEPVQALPLAGVVLAQLQGGDLAREPRHGDQGEVIIGSSGLGPADVAVSAAEPDLGLLAICDAVVGGRDRSLIVDHHPAAPGGARHEQDYRVHPVLDPLWGRLGCVGAGRTERGEYDEDGEHAQGSTTVLSKPHEEGPS
jgi:hypothetical protein